MNLRVRFKEFFDRRAFVRREIVGDHVDLLTARLVDHDVGEEGDELRGGVPLRGLAQDFASLRIEGGVQGQGAMPVVLKSVPFGASRRERQHRIFAIKGLNGRFLIAPFVIAVLPIGKALYCFTPRIAGCERVDAGDRCRRRR
jgi:hypothetical protein